MSVTTEQITAAPEVVVGVTSIWDTPKAGSLDYVPQELSTFLTTYLVVAGIVGIIGNGMTIFSIVSIQKLKTIPNVYVANLAVTDFLMCLVGVPFSIYAHNEGSLRSSEEGGSSSLCQFMGFFTLNSMCMSMYNLTLIAINRYILLVKGSKLYSKMYTRRKVVLSVIAIYVLGIIVVVPPLLGFGKIRFNQKMGICLFAAYDTLTYWYVQSILHGVVAGPVIVITMSCYITVILYFSRTQTALRRMQQSIQRNGGDRTPRGTKTLSTIDKKESLTNGSANLERIHASTFSDDVDSSRLEDLDLSSSGNHSESNKEGNENGELSNSSGQYKAKAKRARASRRVIVNLMTVFIVFLIFWLPIITIFTVDFHNRSPAWVSRIFITFAISNSSVNVFIYSGMNRIFRRSYYYILSCNWSKLRTI